MTVTRFLDAIKENRGPYTTFMRKNGPTAGIDSVIYPSAYEFFKKPELAGVPAPKKQKTKDASVDLSAIHLDGEQTDSAEVYDTCDEIRRKINACLKKPGVTQAPFLKDLHTQFHDKEKAPKTLGSPQLQSFRGKKGPDAGATSAVSYAAYVFFEKLRIKEGKPKSKHREEMEGAWGHLGGFDLETPAHNKRFTVMAGEKIHGDKLGRVSIAGGPFEAVKLSKKDWM